MKKLISHLYHNVPFYKDYIFDEVNDNASPEYVQNQFEKLPIIDKQMIKSAYGDFVVSMFPREIINEIVCVNGDTEADICICIDDEDYWVEYTSGTSGTSLPIIKSLKERTWLGIGLWKMRRRIAPVSPDKMFEFMHNKKGGYPFPFEFEAENRDKRKIHELQYLQQSNYSWWHIFPSQLEIYCEYSQFFDNKKGRLKVIECNGAYISEEDMKRYGMLFGCQVTNNYGCREVWNIAYSCKENSLHVNEENIYFELIDEEEQVIHDAKQVGEVVVTAKNLRVMPFVRYRTGDYAYYVEGECSCGCASRRISLETGRNTILGTKLKGTDIFRSVILDLKRIFGVQADAINVMQKNYNEFIVYVKGYIGEKTHFENSFVTCASAKFMGTYDYIFEYDTGKVFKSVFVAVCNGDKTLVSYS